MCVRVRVCVRPDVSLNRVVERISENMLQYKMPNKANSLNGESSKRLVQWKTPLLQVSDVRPSAALER